MSDAVQEVDLTIEVKSQRNKSAASKKKPAMKKPAASMKKRPAAFAVKKLSSKTKGLAHPAAPAPAAPAAQPASRGCVDMQPGDAVAGPHGKPDEDQYVSKSHLRLLFKMERGQELWAIKLGKHQLMQVTVAKAGSIDKAENVCTFLMNMFDSSTLGADQDAR